MTKNKAIELAYIEIIKHKFDEDAVQHCFELLLGKPDDFIIHLQEQKKLVNYIFKVIHCTIKFSHSNFNYNRLKSVEILLDDDEWINLQNKTKDVEEDSINLNNIYWFDKELLTLYSEHECNALSVSKQTLIPQDSIRRAVKRAKNKYKENEEIRYKFFRR